MIPRILCLSALLIAVGCNSPSEPPVAQIPVSKALAVVEPLKSQGRGCGIMKWNGSGYGMSSFIYADVKVPWKWRTADRLSYTYAEIDQKLVLVSVSIDGHEYRRDDPSETHLTWRRYLVN